MAFSENAESAREYQTNAIAVRPKDAALLIGIERTLMTYLNSQTSRSQDACRFALVFGTETRLESFVGVASLSFRLT